MLWLLFGACAHALSQTITVLDRETGMPVELVALVSESPRAFIITNTKGQADISAFRGAEKITIRTIGYKTAIKSYAELENTSFRVLLDVSNLNLDEVVISATRWRQPSGEVPLKIVSIAPREMDIQNPQTAADLLGISGKVYIQKSQQGGGSPMIRGFATNRLLYVVDGVRINTAIFRGGNLQNVINLDPFATENAEVLFGPGSVIYGSDAIGGVMSFQTLAPQLSLSDQPLITGKALARYSSANQEKTGHFDLKLGWGKWALVTSFSSWDYGHLRQGSNGPEDYLKPFWVQRQDSVDRVIYQDDQLLQIPSAYAQVNLMQKVQFRPDENWDLQYGFHYSETTQYGRYDRHNRTRNGLPRYAEWNYGPQLWMMNNLEATHHGSNPLYDRITLRGALQSFEESRIDRSFNQVERNTQAEKVKAFSANLDLMKSHGSHNKLFYGVEYVRNGVNSTGDLTDISTGNRTPGPSRYPQSVWNSLAVYVEDQARLSDRLSLLAGLRYNHYSLAADFDTTFYPFPFTSANISHGSLTGSIGTIYRPTVDWIISANFGTAFRSPNVDDIGKVFDSEPGSVTVPNPGLEAEYAYSFDLSLARVIGGRVKLDATGYYTLLKNAMVRRDYTLNGRDSILYYGEPSRVQAIQNAAEARVYGVQAGLEVKLPRGFSFSSDLNYQTGKEELDDGSISPARHAAPLFGVSRLNYTASRLHLKLYAVYQGKREYEDMPEEERAKDEIYAKDAGGNNYAPSWYTINLKAKYLLTDHFQVSTGIENLTDRRYRPYSSGISGPGRNFILSLRATF